MSIAVVVVPCCIFSFFMGFYLQVALQTLVDIKNRLGGLKMTQERIEQKQSVEQSSKAEFVEPVGAAEWEAMELEERRRQMNK